MSNPIDRDIDISELGAGPAVVFVHGVPTTADALAPMARALADGRRALVVGLPGYGKSRPLPGGFGVEHVTSSIERAVLARGVSSAVFIGFSGGGYHALSIACRGTIRASAVVVLGGFAEIGVEERAAFEQFAALLRSDFDARALMTERMFSPAYRAAHPAEAAATAAAWLEATSRENLAREMDAFVRAPDLLDGLANLAVPVLARVGALDMATPPARSERIARAAPSAELEIVPCVGHACFIEDEADTLASIRRFLGRQGASAPGCP